MSFTEQDFLNNIEIKVINNPLLLEDLKDVINGKTPISQVGVYFANLIANGSISEIKATRFVEKMVAIEENAGAQLEDIWSQL